MNNSIDRDFKALLLRAHGHSLRDIALYIGVSKGRAWQILRLTIKDLNRRASLATKRTKGAVTFNHVEIADVVNENELEDLYQLYINYKLQDLDKGEVKKALRMLIDGA